MLHFVVYAFEVGSLSHPYFLFDILRFKKIKNFFSPRSFFGTDMDNPPQKILVIDDDISILQVMQMRLELLGYGVVTCQDPEEAISVFEQDNFSAVLTDQRMNGVKGSDLIDTIHYRDPHVPIIIMTAFGTVEDAVDSVRKGAYTYLEKPVDAKELELHIKRALEKRAMEQRLARERQTWVKVLGSLGAALVLLNSDRTVAWMNSIAQDLFGADDYSQGRPCTEIIPQGSLPCAECPVEKALSSGTVQSIEHHNQTTNKWFLVTVTPIEDLQGNIVQAAELTLDITKIKQAQDIVLKQERIKGALEMAGTAAHELNQPMQAVLGWGELLKNRLSIEDPNYHTLESICLQIEKLGVLTSKISNVTNYVTKDYPGTQRIIDLDRASAQQKDAF